MRGTSKRNVGKNFWKNNLHDLNSKCYMNLEWMLICTTLLLERLKLLVNHQMAKKIRPRVWETVAENRPNQSHQWGLEWEEQLQFVFLEDCQRAMYLSSCHSCMSEEFACGHHDATHDSFPAEGHSQYFFYRDHYAYSFWFLT